MNLMKEITFALELVFKVRSRGAAYEECFGGQPLILRIIGYSNNSFLKMKFHKYSQANG